MTMIRKSTMHLGGLFLIAALIIAGRPAKLAAKEFCWEECRFEVMGGCWWWKKACLDLSENSRDPTVRRADGYDRSPARQQIPTQIDSLLAGGGLSTALDAGVQVKTFGDLSDGDILH
jgi:hypothetical protein